MRERIQQRRATIGRLSCSRFIMCVFFCGCVSCFSIYTIIIITLALGNQSSSWRAFIERYCDVNPLSGRLILIPRIFTGKHTPARQIQFSFTYGRPSIFLALTGRPQKMFMSFFLFNFIFWGRQMRRNCAAFQVNCSSQMDMPYTIVHPRSEHENAITSPPNHPPPSPTPNIISL